MRLNSIDYIYVLLSSLAGVWQWWCAVYGRDNFLTVILGILMSLPFALSSYAYASSLRTSSTVVARLNWKRILVLWAGMPLSLVMCSLTVLAQTQILYAVGFGTDNLPFYTLRLVIGEGAACLVSAICLLIWSRELGSHLSRSRLLAVFAILFAGVVFAYGLSYLILRSFHKDMPRNTDRHRPESPDIFVVLTSVVATTISALILIFLRRKATEVSGSRPLGFLISSKSSSRSSCSRLFPRDLAHVPTRSAAFPSDCIPDVPLQLYEAVSFAGECPCTVRVSEQAWEGQSMMLREELRRRLLADRSVLYVNEACAVRQIASSCVCGAF